MGADKPVEGIRSCYRFTVKAAADQIAKQDVTEEKTTARVEPLQTLNEDRLKVLMAAVAIPDRVKDDIRKGTSMIRNITQLGVLLKDLRAQQKEITDEQAHIKGNLEKLPATSELYKHLIDKFDKQETELEKVQQETTGKVADEKQQQKEFEDFLLKLSGK